MNPFEPPKALQTAASVAVDPQDDFRARLRGDSRGRRIAGWFLIASAAVSIVALFAPGVIVRPFSIVLDVVVGIMLVSGYGKAAAFALFWTALGIVAATLAAFKGNPDPIFFIVPYALGLTLLVAGTPGKGRLILGCVFFSLYVLPFAGVVALIMAGKI